jgi:predicted nucleotidyltransferase
MSIPLGLPAHAAGEGIAGRRKLTGHVCVLNGQSCHEPADCGKFTRMNTTRRTPSESQAVRWHRGADIPMHLIRRFARQVAERFRPEKIILFGSYAYGTPHADSDVDILVIMPCRNELDQAVKIRLGIDYDFPLDLLVRKPKEIEWRLADGDLFHTHILTKGKVLYEKSDPRVGGEGRRRFSGRQPARSRKRAAS